VNNIDHALVAKRAEVDQRVLANLLRLNHARAKGELAVAKTPSMKRGRAKRDRNA
jgi:hypothetical protein